MGTQTVRAGLDNMEYGAGQSRFRRKFKKKYLIKQTKSYIHEVREGKEGRRLNLTAERSFHYFASMETSIRLSVKLQDYYAENGVYRRIRPLWHRRLKSKSPGAALVASSSCKLSGVNPEKRLKRVDLLRTPIFDQRCVRLPSRQAIRTTTTLTIDEYLSLTSSTRIG